MAPGDRASVPTAADLSPASAVITGRGWHVPTDVLSNRDIARCLDDGLLSKWVAGNKWCQERLEGRTDLAREELEGAFIRYVTERIGIRTRHVIDREAIVGGKPSRSGVFASDLGAESARKALEDAQLAPEDIDLIVCGTSSPDQIFPTTACAIQGKLGATNAHGYDLLAACSAYAYALHAARGMIEAGIHRRALVVSAEYFTAAVNYSDPNNSFFWGDAAATTVLERADLVGGRGGFHVFDSHCVSIPSRTIRTGLGGTRPYLAGASRVSGTRDGDIELGAEGDPYFYQDGRQVYRDVVPTVVRETAAIIGRNDLAVDDVRRFYFHQPSRLVIEAITKRLLKATSDDERVAVSLPEYGNTSSCGSPLCFSQDQGLEPGDVGCFAVFGAGYTIGLGLFRTLGR